MRNIRSSCKPPSNHPIIEAGDNLATSKQAMDDWNKAADQVLADADE